MGYITIEILGAAKPVSVQLSDSKLTVKRVLDVIGISLRRADLESTSDLSYVDASGNTVWVCVDKDVARMFLAAREIAPAKLQVQLYHFCVFQQGFVVKIERVRTASENRARS